MPSAVLSAVLMAACSDSPSDPVSLAPASAARGRTEIKISERPVIVGEVIEELSTSGYLYLHLSVLSTSADPEIEPHAMRRWVAVEGKAPSLGEVVRLRSLARRSRVWDAELERDFAVLEYVAFLDP